MDSSGDGIRDSPGWSGLRTASQVIAFTIAASLAIGVFMVLLYASVVHLEPYTSTSRERSIVGLVVFVGAIATATYLLVRFDRDDADASENDE